MPRQTNRILSLPNLSRPTDNGGAYREPLVLQKFRPAATKGFSNDGDWHCRIAVSCVMAWRRRRIHIYSIWARC